jgi:hypothetical protein
MCLRAIRECDREAETQLGDFWKKEKQTKPKETWASQDKLKYDFYLRVPKTNFRNVFVKPCEHMTSFNNNIIMVYIHSDFSGDSPPKSLLWHLSP